MDGFYVPPGSTAQPTDYTPPPADPNGSKPVGDHIAWSSNEKSAAPEINLFQAKYSPAPPVAAVPAPVVPEPAPKSKSHIPMIVVAVIIGLAAAGGVYVFATGGFTPKKPVAVVTPSPTPSPTPTPSPSPTPTPSATPSPTPSPTSTPSQTITAPTVTPTSSNPQNVKVTSPSGLWLRSTPTSVDRSNIIGWMPDGATVSVDSVGSFWWHGSYNGRSGYFASKYTQ